MNDSLGDALRALVAELVRDELARQRPPDGPDRLLSLDEAAALLGIKKTRLYRELNSGQLRSVRSGARRLIPSRAITDWVETQEAPRS